MCGIAGIVSAAPLSPTQVDAIRRANAALIHRGPDGQGEFLPSLRDAGNDHVFLAMRRLSIIDLGGGWQPLFNQDESIALVANGEIYNYPELAEKLRPEVSFRTGSDCEVIVHLYERYGLDFVKHLRGMFAFALWDSRARRLVVARDRMGEKPLYLAQGPGYLAFASEMKAMLASGLVPFELNPASVHEFLHFGWVPEPSTMVNGVSKLEPGHMLVIDTDPWRVETRKYWDLEAVQPVEGDPRELIRAELETVGKLIVRSDVPVGVALSGGVDSSLIAAIAARQYGGTIQAFTVGYRGRPPQDERTMAEEFASKLRMPLFELEISAGEMVDFFPHLSLMRDDPIADIAGYGYQAVSRLAREKNCPVLLQGQGGDELFWGYEWSVAAVRKSQAKARGEQPSSLSSFLAALPRGLSRNEIARFVHLCGTLISGWGRLVPDKRAPTNQLVFYDLNETFQIGAFAATSTYTRQFSARLGDFSAASSFARELPWERVDLAVLSALCSGYLLQNGIAQGDRLAMANSVELRLPLVDYKLVELVVGLQKSSPSHSLPPKQWLRDAASDLLPAEVLQRKKRGFNPPVSTWIEEVRKKHGHALESGYLVEAGVLDPAVARSLARKHSRFSTSRDLFWKYLELEFWCRNMSRVVTGRLAS